jgi:hypothetical protein
MILTGYVLCLLGLFIACVIVKGFYTTLAVYGIVHVGCALGLLFLCRRVTNKPRKRLPSSSLSHTPEGITTTDPESDWVITVNLN